MNAVFTGVQATHYWTASTHGRRPIAITPFGQIDTLPACTPLCATAVRDTLVELPVVAPSHALLAGRPQMPLARIRARTPN